MHFFDFEIKVHNTYIGNYIELVIYLIVPTRASSIQLFKNNNICVYIHISVFDTYSDVSTILDSTC